MKQGGLFWRQALVLGLLTAVVVMDSSSWPHRNIYVLLAGYCLLLDCTNVNIWEQPHSLLGSQAEASSTKWVWELLRALEARSQGCTVRKQSHASPTCRGYTIHRHPQESTRQQWGGIVGGWFLFITSTMAECVCESRVLLSIKISPAGNKVSRNVTGGGNV